MDVVKKYFAILGKMFLILFIVSRSQICSPVTESKCTLMFQLAACQVYLLH